ncbi:GNAT family N-acetyltransferase [Candidatus Poribacteria bacterium]|nr:GNAT family N-acetyltransferase [Candidatus Poribacteria bacterium]
MKIRPFKASDSEQLSSLYTALYQGYKGSIFPSELRKFEEYKDLDATIEYALSLETGTEWKTFVAEAEDSRLVGFISGSIGTTPYYKLDRHGMVENFFVEQRRRGRGVGKQLYLRLEEWFKEKDCKVAKSDTWSFNQSAIYIYEKLGFRRLVVGFVKEIVDTRESYGSPPLTEEAYRVRPLSEDDRHDMVSLLEAHWGSTKIVSRGRLHYADQLPGFLAVSGGKPVGLATYKMDGNQCEIVTLNSEVERTGIGTALIAAVKGVAVSAKCGRLWVVATNDNIAALRFYQKRGFTLVAVHRNAVEQARNLKPEIPVLGLEGIRLKDEIELEMLL